MVRKLYDSRSTILIHVHDNIIGDWIWSKENLYPSIQIYANRFLLIAINAQSCLSSKIFLCFIGIIFGFYFLNFS